MTRSATPPPGSSPDRRLDPEPRSTEEAHVHLQILGEARQVAVEVRTGPARVADLLEPARVLSATALRAALAHAEASGESVQCRAGCAACCHHLVPISVVEAARLAAVVAAMPAPERAAAEARFAAAVVAMEAAGLLDPHAAPGRQALQSTARDGGAAWLDISGRYFDAHIPCPFLVEARCSVYDERPMVCREYNVVTDPARCARLDGGARAIERPLHTSEALGSAAAEALQLSVGMVPLPLLLEWTATHGGALQQPRDGETLFWALMRALDTESERPFEERG